MKLYIVHIIFFFSKTVDENNCKLKTRRLNFAGNSIIAVENFSKSCQDFAFIYSHGLSFHDLSEYFIVREHETGGND